MLDRARAAQLAAAAVAGVAIGYLAHRPAARVETRTVVKNVDRVVVQERRVEVKGDTVTVAGPVRTEVRRVLVQVPGQPPHCEETIVTERAPVVSDRRTDAVAATATKTEVVTRIETRTVAAPLPRWSLEARAGVGPALAPLAGLGLARCFGPLCAGAWADAAVSPVRPRAGGVSLSVRW